MLDEDWVDAIFAKFALRYRERWTSHIAGDRARQLAKREWAECLAGMTAQQVRTALDVTGREFDWPPTPAEFRKAGEGHAESVPHWQMRRRYQRSLPPPPMTDERREQHRADLRLALRGEYPVDPELVAGGGG